MDAITPFRFLWPFRSTMDRDFAELMDRYSELRGPQLGTWNLSADLIENPEGYVVKAEVPGLELADIEVNLSGNTLTIQGEKKREAKKEGENFHQIERMEGSFYRTIRFPSTVRQEGVEALLQNGVLTITVPKAEPAKAATIKVKKG